MKEIKQDIRQLKRMIERLVKQQSVQETEWIDTHAAARLLHVKPRYLTDERKYLEKRGIISTKPLNRILYSRQSILEFLASHATKHPGHEQISTTDKPYPPR